MSKSKLQRAFFLLTMLVFLTASFVITAKSQTEAEMEAAAQKLIPLYEEQKYVEALPYAEILVKGMPDNPKVQFIYGFCLLGKSKNIKDKEEQRQLVIKARQSFVKSKQLGNQDQLVDALIASLPENGIMSGNFSKNEAAEDAMNEAEAVFTQGKYDEALALYQKALKLDPTIYEAALFSGDMYTQKGDFDNAEIWYQKAILINPNRETAYRYSATPIMKKGKAEKDVQAQKRLYDQARDRYIEAYIVEPFSKFSTIGINQWADVTQAQLGHPKIDVPQIKYDANGKASTIMGENSLTEGSKAWLAYSLTRENWHKEKFAKTFVGEKDYRHSLQEEAEAIRSVLKSAKEQKLSHPHFVILQKLDDEGLLESFILLALTDDGIYEDYQPYLKANRSKLRQYVLNYVIQK